MFRRYINTRFKSTPDEFLDELRQKLPLSKSQRQEIDKHKKIAFKRDNVVDTGLDPKIWREF